MKVTICRVLSVLLLLTEEHQVTRGQLPLPHLLCLEGEGRGEGGRAPGQGPSFWHPIVHIGRVKIFHRHFTSKQTSISIFETPVTEIQKKCGIFHISVSGFCIVFISGLIPGWAYCYILVLVSSLMVGVLLVTLYPLPPPFVQTLPRLANYTRDVWCHWQNLITYLPSSWKLQ